ncbi:MAG: hypothetical protein DHS80DRAFT_23918 [Piptocephalis tieghemiana]|nr:MAG: hypothetical protein DHS80DRAFT_23918 [Piptocephalis tieghemiana]
MISPTPPQCTPIIPSYSSGPTQSLSALSDFAARTAHLLWHTSTGQWSAPSSSLHLYSSCPPPLISLVHASLRTALFPSSSSSLPSPKETPLIQAQATHLLTLALLYLQRYVLSASSSRPKPSPGSEARAWSTALTLALKAWDDRGSRKARAIRSLFHLSGLEASSMERDFLLGMSWSLQVSPSDYRQWVQQLSSFRLLIHSMLDEEKSRSSSPGKSKALLAPSPSSLASPQLCPPTPTSATFPPSSKRPSEEFDVQSSEDESLLSTHAPLTKRSRCNTPPSSLSTPEIKSGGVSPLPSSFSIDPSHWPTPPHSLTPSPPSGPWIFPDPTLVASSLFNGGVEVKEDEVWLGLLPDLSFSV